jgi:hypothetical protein
MAWQVYIQQECYHEGSEVEHILLIVISILT